MALFSEGRLACPFTNISLEPQIFSSFWIARKQFSANCIEESMVVVHTSTFFIVGQLEMNILAISYFFHTTVNIVNWRIEKMRSLCKTSQQTKTLYVNTQRVGPSVSTSVSRRESHANGNLSFKSPKCEFQRFKMSVLSGGGSAGQVGTFIYSGRI